MSAPMLWKHFAEFQSAPMSAITVAAAGSFAGQIAAVIQAAPLWLYLLAALAPWVPVFLLEVIWTYRHYRWLAVFCLILVSQAVYLFEHAAQLIQIHVLGRALRDAPGIFGALDFERVQFLWSTWAMLAVLLLVSRFPRNPWLWLALVVSVWDAAEHIAIMASYLSTGEIGAPGLLAHGGPFGGLLERADLQLLLSVLELAALALAFVWQVGRTYDAWLARAFPQLPEQVLIETTAQLEELRLRPGERVASDASRSYIITSGTGTLVRAGPGGHDILVRMLSPGQVVQGEGTLCAESTLEVLLLPANGL